MRTRFWERFSLAELNAKEWEALCDGCAKCCLVRQVDDTKVRVFNISCDLLDVSQRRCQDYEHRLSRVSHCHALTPENVTRFNWLPESCAYRRLSQGKPLAKWHPLLTGSAQAMLEVNMAVTSEAIPLSQVPRHRWHAHIIKTRFLS
ncbi:YkgJ family cysteine cluster protein [Oceanisphaera avium]|uniref:Uncharacterized protein n=1 Tax=Oceanisphaera avium TaxID=1903694 RepID=A0A1Y0CVP2_9GAMM|nr:YcgN family cysteine cluster protein [Oceanisphaera avium]ART79410.1 hypothetical protein CBP12_03965 [Oceanisphaera avium]